MSPPLSFQRLSVEMSGVAQLSACCPHRQKNEVMVVIKRRGRGASTAASSSSSSGSLLHSGSIAPGCVYACSELAQRIHLLETKPTANVQASVNVKVQCGRILTS